jgi:hypothetical protein
VSSIGAKAGEASAGELEIRSAGRGVTSIPLSPSVSPSEGAPLSPPMPKFYVNLLINNLY